MSKKNNVRSGQLLSPFGIGQIVNLPEEVSVMIGGLSLWDEKIQQVKDNKGADRISEIELRFNETRLQNVLGVDYFVKPFEYKTSGSKNNRLEIPVVRFPSWHYCTNSSCGRMRQENLYQANKKIECIACSDAKNKNNSKMIPVRFVAACPAGHIQDVPFVEWVHNGAAPNDGGTHDLSYHTGGGSGDLGSIIIKCSCGQSKSLAGLMNVGKDGFNVFNSALAGIGSKSDEEQKFDKSNPNNNNPAGQYCKGYRPWLGLEGINDAKACNNHLQVLIRGGSNVHFSEIQSAIFLPQFSGEANEYVANLISTRKQNLQEIYDLGGAILKNMLKYEEPVAKGLISQEDLYNGIIAELSNEKVADTESDIQLPAELKLRFEEYEYILAGRESENSDFKAVIKTFKGYDQEHLLEKYFENVILIERLKETRVFKGFSRINPNNNFDITELSNKPVNWLPAVEVYGEGIFLKFRDDVVDQWLNKHQASFLRIIERYHSAQLKRRPEEPKKLNAFFIAMHTFAHLLIKKLCFECGYGSSSLRERLYFSDDPMCRMNGILIYTSSGDSEGSLGGLVNQGKAKNLGLLVKNAIADAQWCSADPVCSDIGQSSGQGPDNVNGSACHNCSILPETSCEEFNMLLDRTTIIGTIDEKIGFFNTSD